VPDSFSVHNSKNDTHKPKRVGFAWTSKALKAPTLALPGIEKGNTTIRNNNPKRLGFARYDETWEAAGCGVACHGWSGVCRGVERRCSLKLTAGRVR